MMREHQVRTTAMNIKVVTQAAGRHGRAFNMPARTAIAPRRGPGRLILLGMFPEHKVKRMFFFNFDIYTFRSTCLHVVQFTPRKTAILFKLFYLKIYITICCRLGGSLLYQIANHALHLVDVFRSTRRLIWFQAPQVGCIFIHGLNKAICQCRDAFAIFISTLDNLVINIGDVTYIFYVPALTTQETNNIVECNHDPSMSNMTVIINCHTTHIHVDMPCFAWNKFNFFTLL